MERLGRERRSRFVSLAGLLCDLTLESADFARQRCGASPNSAAPSSSPSVMRAAVPVIRLG